MKEASTPALLDPAETYHFFNDEMVFCTNEIRRTTEGLGVSQPDPPPDPRRVIAGPSSSAMMYDQLFEFFSDVYSSPESKIAQHDSLKRKICSAIATFADGFHMPLSYKAKKQIEFLRVCHTRALEEEKCRLKAKLSSGDKSGATNDEETGWLRISRRRNPTSVALAPISPREWPHLPHRDPQEWKGNDEAIISFLTRLVKLPVLTLKYEPMCLSSFVHAVFEYLCWSGLDVRYLICEPGDAIPPSLTQNLNRKSLSGVLTLFAMAVQLQSPSLVVLAAFLLVHFGKSAILEKDMDVELLPLVKILLTHLVQFGREPLVDLPHPRGLSAHWRICSYQPTTSDAIATDGRFLYIFGRSGLLKVGTGNGHTVRDYVYQHNKAYCRSRDAERSWLCCIDNHLYCRTIVTPGHCVDRINCDNLEDIEELLIAPRSGLFGGGITNSSVYAMISDCKFLYTVKCIDTSKTSKKSTKRAKKNRVVKTRKSIRRQRTLPVRSLDDLANLADNSTSESQGISIRIGDRVVRGPDWKWSNQDGGEGCLGTVERISSWGDDKGNGVTVRWDKAPRVNTYRWGAEGCYDLVIVKVKDGRITERLKLPKQQNGPPKNEELSEIPRHQFVVYKHNVSDLTSVRQLDDEDIGELLDLLPTLRGKGNDQELGIVSALHSHALFLCEAPTVWMCDGALTGCVGEDQGRRFRCKSGCDYDLCETCLLSTMIGSSLSPKQMHPIGAETPPRLDSRVGEHSTEDDRKNGEFDDLEQDIDETLASYLKEEIPFASVDDSFFTEEIYTASQPAEESKRDDEMLIQELKSFWNGHFSEKECSIALRRNDFNIEEACCWLHQCGERLRRRVIISTSTAVQLNSTRRSGSLDPVLLIAGSFYSTAEQLCVVAPPGLYAMGDEITHQSKRTSSFSDAAWVFSIETGDLVLPNQSPMVIKNVPAGSPICYDPCRGRILMFSSYLNELQEYVSTEHISPGLQDASSLERDQRTVSDFSFKSAADLGMFLFNQLKRIARRRSSLPAFRHPRAALEEYMVHLESDIIRNAENPTNSNNQQPIKVKSRRLRNIRTRLLEMDRLGITDPPGFFSPFSVDFSMAGFLFLLSVIVELGTNKVMRDFVLMSCLLSRVCEVLEDFEAMGARILQERFPSKLLEEAESLLFGLATGEQLSRQSDGDQEPLQQQIVVLAKRVVIHGMRLHLFCVTPAERIPIIVTLIETIRGASPDLLPNQYFRLMLENDLPISTRYECQVSMLCCLLQHSIYGEKNNIICRLPDSDALLKELSESLFRLSLLEYRSWLSDPASFEWRFPLTSPVHQALHSFLNCVAIRLYDVDLSTNDLLQRQMDQFELFASKCLSVCTDILLLIPNSCSTLSCLDEMLRCSVVGSILPLLLATIGNFPTFISPKLRSCLVELLIILNGVAGKRPSSQYEHSRLGVLCGEQIVESAHPYSRSQPAFRHTVRIPGASFLHFEFDSRCQTVDETDIISITPGKALLHADRISYGDIGIGDAGGCFFGSYRNGTWPVNGLTILGDSATVMVCSTNHARDDDDSTEANRWGFRCLVRGLKAPSVSWLNDVSLLNAYTCSLIGEQLVYRDSQHLCEVSTGSWTDEKLYALIRGRRGFDGHDDKAATILDNVFDVFKPRFFTRTSVRNAWNDALRLAAKCLIMHSEIIGNHDNSALFTSVVNEVRRIEQWMLRRTQLEREWYYLLGEGIDLTDFKERYQTNSERLREFCELKDVIFSKTDLDESAFRLFQAMTAESEKAETGANIDHHMAVVDLVVRKVNFVMELTQPLDASSVGVIDGPADDCMKLVTSFVQSHVKLTDVENCLELQTRRALQRCNGLRLYSDCERALNSDELRCFFVGRLLVRLPQDDRRCSDLGLCAGCQLLPSFCSKIESLVELIIQHSVVVSSAKCSKGLSLRVLALAEACVLMTEQSLTAEFVYNRLQAVIELLQQSLCGYSDSYRVEGHLVEQAECSILWILLRYLLSVLPTLKLFESRSMIRQLFKQVEAMLDAYLEVCSKSSSARPYILGLEGLQRLLSTLIQNGYLLIQFSEVERWIDRCIELLGSSFPPGVCSAAVRLLTVIVRATQDSPQTLECLKSKIDKGFVEKLLFYAGDLCCLAYPKTNLRREVVEADAYCVVIFQTDDGEKKIADVIQNEGEPDLAFLNIPHEVFQHEKSPVQSTEAVSNNLSVIHRGVRCDGCNQNPLKGMRFKCFTCSNYDLCMKCYVGKKHNEDHQFVRLCDSSGMGDLLPPRSKGGSILPESSVLGSLEWKASVLRAELVSKGYVVFRVTKWDESVACAKRLAAGGLLVSVISREDVDEIGAFNDWECQIHLALEPGSVRFSKRACTSQSSFNSWKTSDLDVIKPLNLVARSTNQEFSSVQQSMEICERTASDVYNLVRTLISGSDEVRMCTMSILEANIKRIPAFYDDETLLKNLDEYAKSLGAINAIGGFEEPIRIGSCVRARERHGMSVEKRGTVMKFDSGNNQICVQFNSEDSIVEVDVSDVVPVQEVELDLATKRALECIAPALVSTLTKMHCFICEPNAGVCTDVSLARSDIGARALRCLVSFLPDWPSILDNRIISTYGNTPGLLLDLANKTQSNAHLDNLRKRCNSFQTLCWLLYRSGPFGIRPITKFTHSDGSGVDMAIQPASSSFSSSVADGDDETAALSLELSYNMYAYSALENDLPQHFGRNKLLEYWEKNVIPAIQSYVRGSFKSYEMDYFFAQLREPLRQGNSAAALKIAFTLCDGHVPSGCHYPDPKTDWSALQMDDIEVGETYLIACDAMDISGWPVEMFWTNGHTGIARCIHASGCVLLQLVNPISSRIERWWYRLEHLRVPSTKQAIGCHFVDSSAILSRTLNCLKQLMCCLARCGVFQLLKVSNEFLTWKHLSPTRIGVRYELETLLRLAAAEDLACPVKLHLIEGAADLSDPSRSSSVGGSASLMGTLSRVLRERLDDLCREFHGQRKKVSPKLSPGERKSQSKPTKAGSCRRPVKTASSSKISEQETNTIVPTLGANMLIESLLHQHKQCVEAVLRFLQQRSFVVASESPPTPVVLVRSPGASCMVITFYVHPVLMDLPPGCSLEFFTDRRCRNRLRGYFSDKSSLNCLVPLVVPGDHCYVKISQGQYARYKFRVDPLTSEFGLALWIADELYHRLSSSLSSAITPGEIESALSSQFRSLADLLTTHGPITLPLMAKIPVLVQTAKLINLALAKGMEGSVPIAKLAVLSRELSAIYDKERTSQKAHFSVYTQQLAEVVSLVEEVSRLKGGSSVILDGEWWKAFVRMVVFTRSLNQKPRDTPLIGNGDKRLQCGRAPTAEVEKAHGVLSETDLFCDRLLIIQQLPRTDRIAELELAVTRFLRHLCLEECGEADDQNVVLASEVIRHGIFSSVLYLAVDDAGFSRGFAVVDVGRVDIIPNLLRRICRERLLFEGPATNENDEMMSMIEKYVKNTDPGRQPDENENQGRGISQSNWTCSVCTLENDLSDDTCAACGSPIPPNFSALQRAGSNPSDHSSTQSGPESTSGWTCSTCTLLNSWSEIECSVCGSERSIVMVPPSLPSNQGDEPTGTEEDDVSCSYASDATPHERHRLSAVKFSHALLASKESGISFEEVRGYLQTRFVDKTRTLVKPLRELLRNKVLQALNNAEGQHNLKVIASILELQDITSELLDNEERAVHKVVTEATHLALESPREAYELLRRLGYDLQFVSSHYHSKEAALQSQVKWTLAMDLQLVSLCRERCNMLGVLTLRELCPSHLISTRCSKEYPLLAPLEVRDLRLRFSVLQMLNLLLDETLPLVNLRSWNDGNSLRNRLANIRQLVFTGVKIRFFTQVEDNTSNTGSIGVALTSSEGSVKKPLVTIDRRKILSFRQQHDRGSSTFSLSDPNASVFAATREQLLKVKARELLVKRPLGASDPFVAFIVIFAGENVVGEGGPYRQLFNDISNELVTAEDSLFIPTPNNWMRVGEFRERLIPKPSYLSKDALRMYEFVGLLMGCCLRTGVRLNIRLAPIVWKMFVKQSLSFVDLEYVDWSLCESLKNLELMAESPDLRESDVIYESFTATLSDGKTIELTPNGTNVPVTKLNCKEYIRAVKSLRLQECRPQVDAMLRGISRILPIQLLQLCTWSELQQWICGRFDIDVALLKRHTRYAAGMTPEKCPQLDMFWNVLASLSEENKRQFINFAWGQETLPADDAEFDRTHTRLLIKPPSVETMNQDAQLPKADTCFFNIELPAYSSEEIMREKLLLAITMCTSMDGDEQAGRLDIYYANEEEDEPLG